MGNIPGSKEISELKKSGVVLLKGFFNQQETNSMKTRVNNLIQNSSSLHTPTDLSRMPSELFTSSGQDRTDMNINPDDFKLSEDLFRQGPDAYKDRVKIVSIRNPFLTVPGLVDSIFQEDNLDFASSYLGGEAKVSWIRIKRTFSNDLPEFDDNFYHVDDNAPAIMKIIIYLNDVDDTGAPFAYIKGSHTAKFEGWEGNNHYTDNDMLKHYPKESIILACGKAGDAVITDTKGFHRETKINKGERTAILANFVLEEEYGGGGAKARIPEAIFDKFTDKQKGAAAFLDIV